jgi:hypothetical protein
LFYAAAIGWAGVVAYFPVDGFFNHQLLVWFAENMLVCIAPTVLMFFLFVRADTETSTWASAGAG